MAPPFPEPNYSIIWSDTFSGGPNTLPSLENWTIRTEGPNHGNGEVQTYTASTSNVSLSGADTLQITPQKDPSTGQWTSARLEGKFAYACPPGRRMLLQAECKLGTARFEEQAGIWPAFWALGASMRPGAFGGREVVDWPECGEWDILETAHGASWTLASVHYGPVGKGSQGPVTSQGGGGNAQAKKALDPTTWHTLALKVNRSDDDWRKQSLEWFLDGERWFMATGAQVGDENIWTNIAHKPFFPILNVAVGSNFPEVGGKPDDKTVTGLGSGLQVKYVAFYQSDYSGWPSWEPDHP